ncbi:hypothetical protein B0J13DRAFT_504833 [Dactylonectria estremocensis]|uniref:tyrosinase n=1 Tax=Dactylonectria estremocensis TaxID=1079267 RepID=A0A9P9IXR3_9HYPO|nr:hypothetical protein B0J13DRAFT_504833 [Dactylonectria estremocensis]
MTITELSETVPATHPPTWNDDILPLITAPPWLPEDRRKSVGSGWVNAMRFYSQWNLDNYDDVRGKATQIYTHLRSKAMPITRDPKEFWPEKALETFRDWANAGFPKDSSSDTVAPYVIIPPPKEPEVKVRERPDIMSLSKEQLATYQAKLDDVLNVGSLRSKWQELGLIHAEWCLHYQEATFLWHRAHLRYVEELIDLPIPYWNGFATATSDPSSKFSGLPPAFLEETYVHPLSGKIRPNPLKYALAIDGVGVEANGEKTKYVTRDPILVGGPSSEGWADKVKLFAKYHQQMRDALKCEVYTTTADAQGLGKPWANILKFTEDQPDDLYPFRMHFDGCFEQVHDNIHGWVGYDMADNSRTAFDPIFLSYHANMDRLASYYMESHPETQFTSSYPLQPFVKNATDVSYTDPRRWIYTTIGDMAKDVRALGYTYLMPASPDVWVPPLWTETHGGRLQVNGGQAISLATQQDMVNSKPNLAAASVASGKPLAAEEQVPYIVFRDVGCTTASYSVDILVAGSREKDAEVLGAGHIGQIARIGMGKGRPVIGFSNTRRVCKAPNSTRVVSAEKFAGQLRQKPNVELIVREMTSGKVLTEEEYTKLPGFKPEVIWLPSRLR